MVKRVLISFIIIFGLFFSFNCFAQDLYEYYNTSDDASSPIYRYYLKGQTFQARSNHSIDYIKLKLIRNGSTAQSLSIKIYGLDEFNYPYDMLAEYRMNSSEIATTSYNWYEINFENDIWLNIYQYYGIVLTFNATSPIIISWATDVSTSTYPYGHYIYSNNNGATWSSGNTNDAMFEVYGNASTSEEITMGSCTTTLTQIINTTTGATFWLDSSLSYGDILIAVFLCIFVIFGGIKFITDLEIPKRMNFKK
jgi:hypothetical protein